MPSDHEAAIFVERMGTLSSGVTWLVPAVLLAGIYGLWAACHLWRFHSLNIYRLADPFPSEERTARARQQKQINASGWFLRAYWGPQRPAEFGVVPAYRARGLVVPLAARVWPDLCVSLPLDRHGGRTDVRLRVSVGRKYCLRADRLVADSREGRRWPLRTVIATDVAARDGLGLQRHPRSIVGQIRRTDSFCVAAPRRF